jgi:8-oxo-dGTP pyrophosphatase MutT (NUDIX family)
MSEAEAAVAIVHARGSAESVLLMRRAEREGDSWSGHWSLPGGRRDPADPDLLHTALRELEEECGVRLARRDFESEMPPRRARRKSGAAIRVTPFLFRAHAELVAAPDGREAVEASWIPLAVLRDPSRHLLLPVPGHPRESLYPGVALNCAPLWGFTYHLIRDWLALGPQPGSMEKAGMEAAATVLEFLLSRGLALRHGWEERPVRTGKTARVAEIAGAIPVADVLNRFARSGGIALSVNCLEVRPESVRILGPAFERYSIEAPDALRPLKPGYLEPRP